MPVNLGLCRGEAFANRDFGQTLKLYAPMLRLYFSGMLPWHQAGTLTDF